MRDRSSYFQNSVHRHNSECGCNDKNDYSGAVWSSLPQRYYPTRINQSTTPEPSLLEQIFGVQQGQPVLTADVSLSNQTLFKLGVTLVGALVINNLIAKNI